MFYVRLNLVIKERKCLLGGNPDLFVVFKTIFKLFLDLISGK